MKDLIVKKRSEDFLEFTTPVILEETKTTRRCFYGSLAREPDGEWNVRGTFVLERKGPQGWQSQEGATLQRLSGGEVAKLELRREHIRKLLIGLETLAEAAKVQGLELRSSKLIVGREEEVVRVVEKEHKAIIQQLIQNERGEEFWEALRSLRPDLTEQLAQSEIYRKRRGALQEFEQELAAQRWSEPCWEKFFQRNEWIFGLGLRLQFLGMMQNQANYGGASYTQKGAQKGEFLLATEAVERFTVLIEIKRPESSIFSETAASKPYRNGVPGFSTEFANAISQVQVNAHTWEVQGSRRDEDEELLSKMRVRTIAPRSILVFGHTRELSDLSRRNSFELFRRNMGAPDVVTFDELLARARFIVRDLPRSS
jgi:hypothetical protein